jgi:DUF2075 family protein
MQMKKKKSNCGCKHQAIREMLGSRPCFENQKNENIFEMYAFQKSKPFKISFNEQIKINWNANKYELDTP